MWGFRAEKFRACFAGPDGYMAKFHQFSVVRPGFQGVTRALDEYGHSPLALK